MKSQASSFKLALMGKFIDLATEHLAICFIHLQLSDLQSIPVSIPISLMRNLVSLVHVKNLIKVM